MPPRKRRSTPGAVEVKDVEQELRTTYAKVFLNPKNTDDALVIPLVKKAAEQLGLPFYEEIRSAELKLELYGMDEFIVDCYRMQAMHQKSHQIELAFDVMAANGLLSREDERGYETEERPPMEALQMTVSSFYGGLKRLNQRIPKKTHTWMLQLLRDPYRHGTLLVEPAETDVFLWTQFKRMIFSAGLLDEHVPAQYKKPLQ